MIHNASILMCLEAKNKLKSLNNQSWIAHIKWRIKIQAQWISASFPFLEVQTHKVPWMVHTVIKAQPPMLRPWENQLIRASKSCLYRAQKLTYLLIRQLRLYISWIWAREAAESKHLQLSNLRESAEPAANPNNTKGSTSRKWSSWERTSKSKRVVITRFVILKTRCMATKETQIHLMLLENFLERLE